MRSSSGERGRSFDLTRPSQSARTLKAAAALSLGMTIGVVGVLVAAPLAVSANDDAGMRQVATRDRASERAIPAGYAERGVFASAPRVIGYYFQPVVRSFAPEPRLRPRPQLPAPILTGYAPRGAEPVRALDETGLDRRETASRPTERRFQQLRRAKAGQSARPVAGLSRQTVCVRLCDGFYFPMTNLSASADAAAQESLCQASCPDAAAKLFTVEAGGSIEDAVSRDLRRYASLPNAFAYQKTRSASCTCQREALQTQISLMRDITLRPGDTVFTGQRAMVFNGATTWPYKPSDFTEFQSSPRLTAADRKKIDSIVGATYAANLLKPYAVAKAQEPTRTAQVEVVRPRPTVDFVRRIDTARPVGQVTPAAAPPQVAQASVTQAHIIQVQAAPVEAARVSVVTPGPSRQIQIVERGSAPGFILR